MGTFDQVDAVPVQDQRVGMVFDGVNWQDPPTAQALLAEMAVTAIQVRCSRPPRSGLGHLATQAVPFQCRISVAGRGARAELP